ncbi:hypothetical protein WKT02_11645 [Erysipelotrichaceae bacterium HCN-30851]
MYKTYDVTYFIVDQNKKKLLYKKTRRVHSYDQLDVIERTNEMMKRFMDADVYIHISRTR